VEVERSSIFDSLAIGYFLAILVIALFLWRAVRERAFGWYAAYLALAILWVLVKRGFAFAYFWPSHPYWNPLASVSLSFLTLGCFALFIRNILSLTKRQPWLSRAISAVVTVEFLFGIVTLFPQLTAMPAVRAAAEGLCLLVGTVVFRTWRRDLFARQILFVHREVVERSDKHLNWIAQELHDNLGQQVSSLRMWMFSLRFDFLKNVMEDLDGKLESLSRGIETALREFCQDLTNLTALDIGFRCEGILPNLTSSVSTHIYRIAQEAVANAMRHAAPETIEISLRSKGNLVQMEIVDDGWDLI